MKLTFGIILAVLIALAVISSVFAISHFRAVETSEVLSELEQNNLSAIAESRAETVKMFL